MTNIGKISFVYKGAYDKFETYKEKDCVTYEGSTFCALKTITGITPIQDDENWWQMAKGNESNGEIISFEEPNKQDNNSFWLLEYYR